MYESNVSDSEKLGFLKRMAFKVDEIIHSSRISVTLFVIILKIKNALETLIKEIDIKVINQKTTNVCAEVSFVWTLKLRCFKRVYSERCFLLYRFLYKV